MRLDRTRIAIIERRQPEILDAALLVLRQFFVPMCGLVMILAVPFSILNHWLISWMAADNIEMSARLRYSSSLAMLIYLEAPLVSSLATCYIGKVMFYDDPKIWDLLKSVGKLSYRLIWVHGIQRGVLIAIAFLLFTEPLDGRIVPAEVVLPILCFVAFIVRSMRPYINEILILELSPLRSKGSEASAGVRSARLHNPHSGDLFGRGVAMVLVTALLSFTILGMLWFFASTLTNRWDWNLLMSHFAMPCALWLLVAYVTVYRFLSYLDLRIRLEGWEVELKIRAEANRLTDKLRLGGAS